MWTLLSQNPSTLVDNRARSTATSPAVSCDARGALLLNSSKVLVPQPQCHLYCSCDGSALWAFLGNLVRQQVLSFPHL